MACTLVTSQYCGCGHASVRVTSPRVTGEGGWSSVPGPHRYCHPAVSTTEKSSSPATREILFAGWWLVAAAAGPSHASSRPVSGPGWAGWRAGPGPPCRAKQQAAARPTEFAALGLGLGPSGAQSVAQNLGTGADMDIGGVEAQCCTADM